MVNSRQPSKIKGIENLICQLLFEGNEITNKKYQFRSKIITRLFSSVRPQNILKKDRKEKAN